MSQQRTSPQPGQETEPAALGLHVDVVLRDLQHADLDVLDWAGGSAHQQAMAEFLQRGWLGEVEVVVAELPTGVLVGHGVLDLVRFADAGHLQTLATRESWRGLGIGTAVIGELERRAVAAGRRAATLTVELDNPRAAALYGRLDYRPVRRVVESWPVDDGGLHHADCELMRKPLA